MAETLTLNESGHTINYFLPVDRAVFQRKWLAMPEAGAIDSAENDQMKGCGVIRKCSPLFAVTNDTAERLSLKRYNGSGKGQPG